MRYPYAQIVIEADESLESLAAILSERLFCRIPFGDKELGLFQEVPGMRLQGDFLGMFIAIHGFAGSYTLLLKSSHAFTQRESSGTADFSSYLAEVIRSMGYKCLNGETRGV